MSCSIFLNIETNDLRAKQVSIKLKNDINRNKENIKPTI